MDRYLAEICIVCFTKLKGPTQPARLVNMPETGGPCALCGKDTNECPGIFGRLWREKDPEEGD
jgi:hypothetical protein